MKFWSQAPPPLGDSVRPGRYQRQSSDYEGFIGIHPTPMFKLRDSPKRRCVFLGTKTVSFSEILMFLVDAFELTGVSVKCQDQWPGHAKFFGALWNGDGPTCTAHHGTTGAGPGRFSIRVHCCASRKDLRKNHEK